MPAASFPAAFAGATKAVHAWSVLSRVEEFTALAYKMPEIPAFEVFDHDGNKVFDTNEDTPCELQEANARLGSAAPRLLASLVTCANLLADYDESDGPEGDAYREAVAAIMEAIGMAA